MYIERSYFRTDTSYKNIGTNPREGQIGCGFIHTISEDDTRQKANFSCYGGFLVWSGEGTYVSEDGKQYPLRAGCFVQRLPNVPHTTIVHKKEEWLEFFVIFGKETYETLRNMGISSGEPVIYLEPDEMLFGKCVYLLKKFKHTQESESMLLYPSVLKLVLTVYQKANHERIGSTGNRDFEKMRLAAALLCDNLKDRKTAQEIAEELGMGYESFRKKFKSLYHISPNAYQLNYRINHGKTLLSNEEKKIEEIAELCGFSDGFAFSKAFKKRCGISPDQFRKSI